MEPNRCGTNAERQWLQSGLCERSCLVHTSKRQMPTIRCLQPNSHVHSRDYRIGGSGRLCAKRVEGARH